MTIEVNETINKIVVNSDDNNIVELITQGAQGIPGADGAQGAQGVPGQGASDGDKGDIVISDSGATYTIDNGVVTSSKIANGTIVNDDINASAAIQGTKINPNFGSQNITTTGAVDAVGITIGGNTPTLNFNDGNDDPDFRFLVNANSFILEDTSNTVNRLVVNSDGHIDITGNLDVGAGLDVTGNIAVSGTVDGRDIATDGTKLDGIETGATADQSASEIKTAYESNSDTNAFTDADHTKLDGIEASADVTDATNVNAAGAVMNSDLDAKGELLVGDGSGDPTALPVGTNGYILKANSSTATGLEWSAGGGGGETNQNAFSNIAVSNQTTVAADSVTDTFTLVAGANVTITTDASNDSITINADDTNTQLSNEQVQDIIGAMVSGNSETNISVTYDDTNGKLNFSSTDTNTTYSIQDGELSQNNFTNTLKTKLDGISSGAEVNVKADFNETDSSSDAFIENKPTIPTNNNQLTNGAGYITATLTNEQVQDIVGDMVSSNTETGITVSYDDTNGKLDFSVASQTDNNFTNADHTKLDGIAANANNYSITTDLLDEDNMASNSATKVPSQQSVKAYVDANSGGGGGGSGLFTSYARISDVKDWNEHGGGVPNDNYFTYRTLNTEDWDADGIIKGVGGKATSGNLKTNNTNYSVTTETYEFALGAGTYLIKYRAPYVQTDASVGWIVDTTANAIVPESVNNSEYAQDSGIYAGGYVSGTCRVTITADNKYAVRQYFQKDRSTYGLGLQSNISTLGRSVYTVVEIYKES